MTPTDTAAPPSATCCDPAFRATYQLELAQRFDRGSPEAATAAASVAARTLLAQRWAHTQAQDAQRTKMRRVHYLSMEFLMGRAMHNA